MDIFLGFKEREYVIKQILVWNKSGMILRNN